MANAQNKTFGKDIPCQPLLIKTHIQLTRQRRKNTVLSKLTSIKLLPACDSKIDVQTLHKSMEDDECGLKDKQPTVTYSATGKY